MYDMGIIHVLGVKGLIGENYGERKKKDLKDRTCGFVVEFFQEYVSGGGRCPKALIISARNVNRAPTFDTLAIW